jgi:hypothetical protein
MRIYTFERHMALKTLPCASALAHDCFFVVYLHVLVVVKTLSLDLY